MRASILVIAVLATLAAGNAFCAGAVESSTLSLAGECRFALDRDDEGINGEAFARSPGRRCGCDS